MLKVSKEYWSHRCEKLKSDYDALMKVYPFTLEDLDGEEWRDIEGYEGLYQVSSCGRVKSFQRGTIKILKPSLAYRYYSYLFVRLNKNKKRAVSLIHSLVCKTFVNNTDKKLWVDHADGNKFNNHVSNLRWVTPAENARYAVILGAKKSGEDNYLAQLTNQQARYVRENPQSLTRKQLAEMFGVSEGLIKNVRNGKTYKNVGGLICKIDRRVPDNIRDKIRSEYVFGSSEFGSRALARKYGVDHGTILNIVHEK